jgi:uncharacterized hydrophobic protein (TIGR00271 family)
MTERRSARERLKSRVEPFWLNPATIKGSIAVLAGFFLLAVPEVSAFVLRLVIGAALVLSGASSFWFGIRGRTPRSTRSTIEAAVALVAGILMIVWPTETVRGLILIGVGYLVVRGVAILIGANSLRRGGNPWATDLIRGLLYISVAVAIVLLPASFAAGLRLILAAAAVILGAIMLVYGIRERSEEDLVDVDVASLTEMANSWLLERDIGIQRRERIGEGIFFEEPDRGSKLSSWWTMLLISVAIATFGIIQDSTAVVIGAMLIAPLMTPILGVAAGIVNSWYKRIVSSLGLVVAGAGAAIGLAAVIGQWAPIIVPLAGNSQVTSRVAPNIVDMMIALAAGSAGAYANVDDRVSDSIAGVAIAVALVPPLGVVGLTLQAGMLEDSWGALLLFLTNLVSIILAAALVFFVTGFAPYRNLRENRSQVLSMLRTVALAAVVIMIPLAFTAEDVVTESSRLRIANDAVASWLEGADLSADQIKVSGSDVYVFLTGPDEIPPVEGLEADLVDEFATAVDLTIEYARTTVVTTNGSVDN